MDVHTRRIDKLFCDMFTQQNEWTTTTHDYMDEF